MKEIKKVLGRRIREAREERKITQKELGEILDYSPMGISHFEKGIRELKVSDIQKLANYFGKDMSFFLQPEVTFFRADFKDSDNTRKAVKDFEKFLDEQGY